MHTKKAREAEMEIQEATVHETRNTNTQFPCFTLDNSI